MGLTSTDSVGSRDGLDALIPGGAGVATVWLERLEVATGPQRLFCRYPQISPAFLNSTQRIFNLNVYTTGWWVEKVAS